MSSRVTRLFEFVKKFVKFVKKGTYKVQVRAFVKQGSKKAYSNWTKVKNVKGELKEYINYTCSFPYTFYEMYGCPNQIYFYKYECFNF